MTEKYSETVEWLFNQIPMFQNIGSEAYKPGLDGVTSLCQAFGNPHKRLKTVHVGGTNGKGSVSSLLASIFQESGLKVGLFTSPHLIDFRERIRINGEMIPESAVIDFIERFRNKKIIYEPSFFELTTVMAFEWFTKNNVDIAVIEVGLGGRLDSTNIISPLLSVITNISFDHTAQLGNTLEAIASEKAGIIKRGVPVIVGNSNPPSVRRIFEDTAKRVGAFFADASTEKMFSEYVNFGNYIVYKDSPWGDIECPLSGDCQPENANTVMTALRTAVSIVPSSVWNKVTAESIRRGFKNVILNTQLTGRWTIISGTPRIIFDTGHNQGGWKWLGRQLREIAESGELHIVAGFVNDKDINAILNEMPLNARYYWATPSVSRGRPSGDVSQIALNFGLNGQPFQSVSDAFTSAKKASSPNATIFIGGSNFIVADFLKILNK